MYVQISLIGRASNSVFHEMEPIKIKPSKLSTFLIEAVSDYGKCTSILGKDGKCCGLIFSKMKPYPESAEEYPRKFMQDAYVAVLDRYNEGAGKATYHPFDKKEITKLFLACGGSKTVKRKGGKNA